MAPVPGKFGIKAEMRNALQMNDIRFDEWSYQIKSDFVPELNVIGQALKEEFQKGGGMNAKQGLLIEGHTDKRGPLEKNIELSKKRAEEIKTYLVKNFGIDASRLKTKGYGPTKPVSPQDDESAYALNRRVEFKKVEELPTERPSRCHDLIRSASRVNVIFTGVSASIDQGRWPITIRCSGDQAWNGRLERLIQ